MHSNRLLRWSRIPAARKEEGGRREKREKRMDSRKKRERGEREMEMEEREGGGRGWGGVREREKEREREVKNLHITMPEKNQNIFHRKMGHFQILVPYQTN